jgi:hypothetical protein
VTLPKQAQDGNQTLGYSIWPSGSLVPHRSTDPPRCALVRIRLATFCLFPYNSASPIRL